MPISPIVPQKIDTGIRYIEGSPWPIRVNNSGNGGGFAVDADRILLRGELPTVILGYQTLLGILPPRSTFESLVSAVKSDQIPNPAKLSANELMLEFARKNLAPHVFITHVPVPGALDGIPENLRTYWPKGVVTGSFFRSIGLTGGDQSLLGPMGLLPLLQTSGKNPADVITIIGFDKKGDGQTRSYHINTFSFVEPTKEDKAELEHIKNCREFIKNWTAANPEATEFPLPGGQLMADLPASEINNPGQAYANLAKSIIKVQAEAALPLEELQQLDIERVVETLMLADNMSTAVLSASAVEDAVIQTVEVKAIS